MPTEPLCYGISLNNAFGSPYIASSDLTAAEIPATAKHWRSVIEFAACFDVELELPSEADITGVADITDDSTIAEMRYSLFVEWRRHNHFGHEPDSRTFEKTQMVLDLLRNRTTQTAKHEVNTFIGALDTALTSSRAIVTLNVPWSAYARKATATLEIAATKLKSLDIAFVVVDEESFDVRVWLNEHAPDLLGGKTARGAGSVLWVEKGVVVDIEVSGGNLTLQELLNRTRVRWDI